MTADVWLPIPPDDIDGLPEGLNYLFWDGGDDGAQEFPGDPADCAVLEDSPRLLWPRLFGFHL